MSWIESVHARKPNLREGQAIGKAHHLRFQATESLKKPTTRITTTEIVVKYPSGLTPNSPAVQNVAEAACKRALRSQADSLLPQRLAVLAEQHNFTFSEVSVRQLKSRWGSCDQNKNIVLNIYLLQLPWELIDYVLLHELAHTKVLRHGPEFWNVLEASLPNAKSYRKSIKNYQPVLT